MSTQIKSCKCNHQYQDERYGKGMRLHNPTSKGKDVKVYRCTICKAEK